eukprot:GEMP01039413.1.p1 GENE.GEMP01039413.1~~GEMP01039413.1.p1  ORF type:complete len:284 (+),score=56.24 GEMP01039413.1:51-854(+)
MPYTPLDIAGNNVLVTGATAGIGEQIAIQFGELGCNLILIGRRAERLENLKAVILKQSPQITVTTVLLDITDHANVAQLAGSCGPVDILVNNAGLALGATKADENNLEDMMTVMNTNVIALMHLVKLFTPQMKERGFGHIVNISSVAAHDCYEGGSVYCASKSAVNAFTIAARMDLADTPIRVTAISPGLLKSEFSEVRFKGDMEKAKAPYQGIVPLHPEDVADQVIYACTRPRHVQIADIISYPTNQGHAKYVIHRVGEDLGAKNK